MLGCITLHSKGDPDRLPIFNDSCITGNHTPGRTNGIWWFQEDDLQKYEVYLPQRDKHISIYSKEEERVPELHWKHLLTDWDSSERKCTQYERLSNLRQSVDDSIDHVSMNVEGTHGSWSVLSMHHDRPIYLTGVHSSKSTYIVWSLEDIVRPLRIIAPGEYSMFRFANMTSHVFMNTAAMCAKWWRWSRAFGNDTLRKFNTLEVMLLKVK